VAHTYNHSYSGGRAQEDQFEARLGKAFSRPYLEKPFTKKGWWNGSR
jgi:hypothetical protein